MIIWKYVTECLRIIKTNYFFFFKYCTKIFLVIKMSKSYFIHDNVSITKDITINIVSALLFLYAFLQRMPFQECIDNTLISILISIARNIGEILVSSPRSTQACIEVYQLTIIIGNVLIIYAYFLSFL